MKDLDPGRDEMEISKETKVGEIMEGMDRGLMEVEEIIEMGEMREVLEEKREVTEVEGIEMKGEQMMNPINQERKL